MNDLFSLVTQFDEDSGSIDRLDDATRALAHTSSSVTARAYLDETLIGRPSATSLLDAVAPLAMCELSR